MDAGSYERERVANEIRAEFEAHRGLLVERALDIRKHGFLPHTHFQAASAEAKTCYIHGHFYGCIMITQAVAEGLIKFIAQRNGEPEVYWTDKPKRSVETRRNYLRDQGHISADVHAAFERIHDASRNSLHHMNRKGQPSTFKELQELARRCVEDMYIIESWLFEFHLDNGVLVPHRRQYWDIRADGTTPVFLNLMNC